MKVINGHGNIHDDINPWTSDHASVVMIDKGIMQTQLDTIQRHMVHSIRQTQQEDI